MVHDIAGRYRPAGRVQSQHHGLDASIGGGLVELLYEQAHRIIACPQESAFWPVDHQAIDVDDGYLVGNDQSFILLDHGLLEFFTGRDKLDMKSPRSTSGHRRKRQ
jgi:hypothetical protein